MSRPICKYPNCINTRKSYGKRPNGERKYKRYCSTHYEKHKAKPVEDRVYHGTSETISTSTWKLEPNPLFSVTCTKCGHEMVMSKEPLITRLKKWARMLKEIV